MNENYKRWVNNSIEQNSVSMDRQIFNWTKRFARRSEVLIDSIRCDRTKINAQTVCDSSHWFKSIPSMLIWIFDYKSLKKLLSRMNLSDGKKTHTQFSLLLLQDSESKIKQCAMWNNLGNVGEVGSLVIWRDNIREANWIFEKPVQGPGALIATCGGSFENLRLRLHCTCIYGFTYSKVYIHTPWIYGVV